MLGHARPILEDLLAYAEEAVSLLAGFDGAGLRQDRMRLLAVTRAVEIVGGSGEPAWIRR